MFQNNLQRNAKETELILSTHIEKEKETELWKKEEKKNKRFVDK